MLCCIRHVCYGRAPFPPAHCVRLCPLLLFLTSYCHLLPQHFLHSALFARSPTSTIYLSSYIYPQAPSSSPSPTPFPFPSVFVPWYLQHICYPLSCQVCWNQRNAFMRAFISKWPLPHTGPVTHRADTLNRKMAKQGTRQLGTPLCLSVHSKI